MHVQGDEDKKCTFKPEQRLTSYWENYVIALVLFNSAIILLFQSWAYLKQQMQIVKKKPKLDQT